MKQYVVDAFTDKVFAGNPAAICILDQWPEDSLMQSMAIENNLSETAFAVKEEKKYHLRWFTPGGEIDLCGHATLACGFVLLNYYEKNAQEIVFSTLSGDLFVKRSGELYEIEFPAYELKETEVTDAMEQAFGVRPIEAWLGRDLLCVFADEDTVKNLSPDFELLCALDGLLQHATARGTEYDCVSRSFAPKISIREDPVCGSGHCHIVPYWSRQLGNNITAYQASKRSGVLYCRLDGNRVFISGNAVLYSTAELTVSV